jgi:hypothetical protein
MFKKTLAAITICAMGNVALAQPEPDTGGGGGTPPTPPANPPPAAAPSDVFSKGTLGISIPFLSFNQLLGLAGTLEPAPTTVDIIYFLSNTAALDLIVGLNLHKTQIPNLMPPPAATDKTIFGFAVGAGYRMYKHKGAMHGYLEPKLALVWPDTSNSNFFSIDLGFDFGVERTIADWFALAGAIGGVASYGPQRAGNTSADIQVATTAALYANFYWK